MRATLVALAVSLLTVTLLAADRKKVRIALPDEFVAVSEELTVKRKAWDRAKEPMTFGDFAVKEHAKGLGHHRSHATPVTPPYVPDPLGIEAESAKWGHGYRFQLFESGAPKWNAECRKSGRSEGTSVRGVPISATGSEDLVCLMTSATNANEHWRLALSRTGTLRGFKVSSQGELTDGTKSLQIEMINQSAGSSIRIPAPLGYQLVAEDGEIVAAIDLTRGRGTFLMRPDVAPEQKTLLAAAMSAILLEE